MTFEAACHYAAQLRREKEDYKWFVYECQMCRYHHVNWIPKREPEDIPPPKPVADNIKFPMKRLMRHHEIREQVLAEFAKRQKKNESSSD